MSVDSGAWHGGTGEVYAGNDGNVYRAGDRGSFQSYDNNAGAWRGNPVGSSYVGSSSVGRSYLGGPATYQQLNRDAMSRSGGYGFGGGGGFRGR